MTSALSWLTSFLYFSLSFAPLPSPVSSSSVTIEPLLPHLLNATTLPAPRPDLVLSLTRQLLGAGFHRTLQTQVELLSSLNLPSDYSAEAAVGVALVESITCDMYIDVDQV